MSKVGPWEGRGLLNIHNGPCTVPDVSIILLKPYDSLMMLLLISLSILKERDYQIRIIFSTLPSNYSSPELR